jgi:hypothetical protein
MFHVDFLIFLFLISGWLISAFTPTSTTIKSAPNCFAIADTPGMPRGKLTVCEYVTDCGVAATPSSKTPLSEDMMIMHRLSVL